jgi:choline dehydrogenase-like flavoprotein
VNDEADYVIVGAGAAGSVLAARLAEDGKRTVILVEAGPDNTADPTIAAAAQFAFLWDIPPAGPSPSPSHLGFISTSQNGKNYCYPRGTGLGGSTNHHACVDGRGSPLVYDEWARQTGDARWSSERLLPYFMKMENFSDIPYVDDRVHGKKGWLHLKRAKLEKGFHPDFLSVAMQDFGVPFRHDFCDNPNNFAGVGWSDMQVHNDGRRSNAAVDLLLPALEKSKKGTHNLRVLTDSLVSKVLFKENRAVGIEVIDAARAYQADVAHRSGSKSAKRLTIKARREVILCGGAINTPQILMLSGVGPKEHLATLGISVVKDLPGVGAHLQDHTEVGHIFKFNNLPDKLFRWQSTFLSQSLPEHSAKADPSSFTENYIPLVLDWFSGHDEPNQMHPDLHVHLATVFFRDFNLNAEKFKDSDRNKASYLDTFLSQIDPKSPQAFHTFLIECTKPEATKGSITLQSDDPTAPPVIDLQLFAAEGDVSRLALGIELVRKIMSHPTIQRYEPVEVQPGDDYRTLGQLKDYVRRYSAFGHHASGTAKMGRASDPMAVVNSQLQVHGLQGLRVCDTSVFPEIPAYNTSRPAYLVGEVLADILTR